MNQAINIALVGASGVVGTKIMQLLEKKAFAVNNFYPLGSSSVGQEVTLNGADHKYSYITHKELVNGGELKFVMGPTPNLEFGTEEKYRPKSIVY